MERLKSTYWLVCIVWLIHTVQGKLVLEVKIQLNTSANVIYDKLNTNKIDMIAFKGEQEMLDRIAVDFVDYCNLNTLKQHLNYDTNVFELLADGAVHSDSEVANEICFSHTNTVEFSFGQLTRFPTSLTDFWFNQLVRLNLSNNFIDKFESFSSIKSRLSLEYLDMANNKLKAIDSDTFKGLDALKRLNLCHNRIESISPFAFTDHVRHLVELDLSNNLLSDASIEFLLFATLTNLKYLNLNNNKLTTLSNHLLLNFYSLEYLGLNGNNLKTFELFQLSRSNEFLKVLDLSFNTNLKFKLATDEEHAGGHASSSGKHKSNNIESLNLAGIEMSDVNMNLFLDSLFDTYAALRVLNVSFTNMKHIESFKWPRSIEVVDLSFNLIEQFDCKQFLYASTLTDDVLDNNNALKLRSLYLNHNRLSDFKRFIQSCSPILNRTYQVSNLNIISNPYVLIYMSR